uniref:Uncharacterized protein n=1 Tax=Alexandrium monilatum TaxID=311494 RepID=A0A7S4PZB1_9DINO
MTTIYELPPLFDYDGHEHAAGSVSGSEGHEHTDINKAAQEEAEEARAHDCGREGQEPDEYDSLLAKNIADAYSEYGIIAARASEGTCAASRPDEPARPQRPAEVLKLPT